MPAQPKETAQGNWGAWGEFSEQQRPAVVHALGDLVLLTKRKNAEASDPSYEQRRTACSALKSTGAAHKLPTYASVQELAHIPEWTPAAFNDRHRRHFELLQRRWFREHA